MDNDIPIRIARLEEKTKSIEDDLEEIKDNIKEINGKLNGYLDKRIETKIRTMTDFFQKEADNMINSRMGRWFMGFALSLITTWLLGFLTGKWFK